MVTMVAVSGSGSAAPDVPDGTLLGLMARGDGAALSTLYDRHATAVYSLALRVLRDPLDAEEVVQEVFAQSWRQADRYDPSRATVAGWLMMQAKSRAIDRLRGRRARPDATAAPGHAMPDMPDPAAGPDLSAVQAEEARRMREALRSLPALQRTAIELAYYDGLTHSEIAERLAQPLGTVKTRIRQGLLTLRGALGPAAVSTP
jgi:RNA polymerase sigma-70 factor (ECF subfamily)